MFRAPVDVVTGWLGSGKTTLVRRLLATPAGARVAVIVNEIAGLDVDGEAIAGLDGVDRAVGLAGGCLCCEVEESRLARAVSSLLDRVQPDLVVVETSGAADPLPAIGRLRDAGLTLDAVIALVDAGNAELDLDRPVGRSQVEAADFVLLNRVDTADPAAIDRVERRISRSNPRALLRRCVRADVEPALLFATGARSALHGHVAFPRGGAVAHEVEARAHCTKGRIDPDRLRSVLASLPAGVHRAKGIVAVPGSAFGLLFNSVRGRVEFEWLPFPARESRAVVVGEGLQRTWPAILAALEACEDPGADEDGSTLRREGRAASRGGA